MKTTEKLPEKIGSGYVEVEWELGDQMDDAGDGHVYMHAATGISDDGHMFEGTGIVCDGQWTDVEDAEFTGMQQWLPQNEK